MSHERKRERKEKKRKKNKGMHSFLFFGMSKEFGQGCESTVLSNEKRIKECTHFLFMKSQKSLEKDVKAQSFQKHEKVKII